MYRKGELVIIKDYILKTQTTHDTGPWEEKWSFAIVIENHGKERMRTGMTRFEKIEVISIFYEGKIRKVPARNLRYPSD